MKLRNYFNATNSAIVFFVAFVIYSNVAQGQEGLKIGLSVSPTINWLKGDNASIESDGAKIGLNYGLFIEYGFSENTAFSTGFLVAYNGAKLNYPDTSYNFKFQYIDAPENHKIELWEQPESL